MQISLRFSFKKVLKNQSILKQNDIYKYTIFRFTINRRLDQHSLVIEDVLKQCCYRSQVRQQGKERQNAIDND